MLEITKLNHYYGESHTLWDVDLLVPAGSCTCLMGRNGVGKTTLLKCIMGLLPLNSGKIGFNSKSLEDKTAEFRARNGIGYVPQGREIFGQLTVEENLRIGLFSRKDGLGEIPEFIYKIFPVLKEMLHRRGGDLSGGQQQQLAIGRALVIDPKVLIVGQPTRGVDIGAIEFIHQRIIDMRDKGAAILLVSVELDEILSLSDRIVVMFDGELVGEKINDQVTDREVGLLMAGITN